ncbi:type I restriction enzyme S subunit [Sphingomonas kyeonggiensis]|uniref:Type I restriction enzyme S subunit n=1 Tax=Sphingomonas kyeonggiensis TaxID=1268553 RepID=A0A7W7NUQ1_9SPHN|nr:restriction endonuclease subunit S [Sphingomonas kyeonggiensis]MBB4841187.1 type I restriction enzyme S subunit [Sphingomonas kyeonggiensis]
MKRIDFPEEELLSVYRDYGVIRKRDRDDNFNKPSEDLGPYQLVEPGDLAINKMKAWQGSLGVSPYRGIVSPAYFVYHARHNELPGYLHYLLRSDPYATGFLTISKGIRINQWDVDPDHLAQLPIPLPSLSEQAEIVAFLDRETAKIDALVEEQRRLIELLKEKRQAVISHAVTKGLNPDAPMKDSGVEWLGEVPSHWAIAKFPSAIDFQEGPGILAVDFHDEGVPLLRVAGAQSRWASLDGCNFLDPAKVQSRWDHFRLELGDLVISGSASMGTVCEVGAATVGAIPYTGLIRLRPRNNGATRDYIRALVSSSLFFTQIDMLKAGATIQHFGPIHLRQMIVTLPPKEEQEKIAVYVEAEHTRFDALLEQASAAITLLQERRAALISAAVTGKIDVRAANTQQAEAA